MLKNTTNLFYIKYAKKLNILQGHYLLMESHFSLQKKNNCIAFLVPDVWISICDTLNNLLNIKKRQCLFLVKPIT